MKKITALLLAFMMLTGVLAGCNAAGNNSEATGTTSSSEQTSTDSDKPDGKSLKIVTTIFPEYDWVREILGDEVGNDELTMLLDNGVDLHSYQPTADDIIKISDCDLFIYVGGESDGWVENALKNATNKNMKVINLLEVLGDSVKNEEVVEGMQETEHHHDHSKEVSTFEDDEVQDRSLSDWAGDWQSAYPFALDDEYQTVVDDAKRKTVLFGDRFPFRYLVDDYGLDYYAAFVGCSAETEASFETISFLAKKVDELKLPCVLTIEGTQHKIAGTIVQNTADKDQKVLTMDSMQSTTSKDVANGTTYLSVMEKNLSVLKEALG